MCLLHEMPAGLHVIFRGSEPAVTGVCRLMGLTQTLTTALELQVKASHVASKDKCSSCFKMHRVQTSFAKCMLDGLLGSDRYTTVG